MDSLTSTESFEPMETRIQQDSQNYVKKNVIWAKGGGGGSLHQHHLNIYHIHYSVPCPEQQQTLKYGVNFKQPMLNELAFFFKEKKKQR